MSETNIKLIFNLLLIIFLCSVDFLFAGFTFLVGVGMGNSNNVSSAYLVIFSLLGSLIGIMNITFFSIFSYEFERCFSKIKKIIIPCDKSI